MKGTIADQETILIGHMRAKHFIFSPIPKGEIFKIEKSQEKKDDK